MNIVRFLAIAIAFQAVSLSATAQQPVHRVIEATATGAVRIELVEGDVTITGWDETRIEVSGELGLQAQSLEVEQQGADTTIRVIEAENAAGDPSETEIYVSVPRASSLVVSTTNADILVTSVAGSLALHTVAGDIDAESAGAAIEAETVGGDIRISGRGARSDATLTTVAGEIEVGGPFSRIVASSVSGDIELDVLEARELTLNTTNGEIEVHATFDGAAVLDAETINGDVELQVGEEGDLNVDAGSFSGRLSTCFDAPADPESAATDVVSRSGRRERDGRRGGGTIIISGGPDSPTVRIRTLNGDIDICSS